jgi:hypothetical protein
MTKKRYWVVFARRRWLEDGTVVDGGAPYTLALYYQASFRSAVRDMAFWRRVGGYDADIRRVL